MSAKRKSKGPIYWYKVFARHGPGHQSSHTFYVPENHKLSRRELRDLWENTFDSYEYPIGNARSVKRLPSKELLYKIQSARGSIGWNRQVLANLLEMAAKP